MVQTNTRVGGTIPLSNQLQNPNSIPGVSPMHARLVHFGPDDCHRLMVLRSAGYAVEECQSLLQLGNSLSAGDSVEALLFSDAEGISPEAALAVAKSLSSLPSVLFRSTTRTYQDSGFDLVVPSLTPPEVWLNDVDALIERTRAAIHPVRQPTW